jgi:hypothetical protein
LIDNRPGPRICRGVLESMPACMMMGCDGKKEPGACLARYGLVWRELLGFPKIGGLIFNKPKLLGRDITRRTLSPHNLIHATSSPIPRPLLISLDHLSLYQHYLNCLVEQFFYLVFWSLLVSCILPAIFRNSSTTSQLELRSEPTHFTKFKLITESSNSHSLLF